jgi:hypothetical protein
MIPVRNKNTDISSDVAAGKKLQDKIKKLAETAANQSINDGKDLDVVLAEISKREKFNRLQIQRLVEESNTVAYNKRYDKLRNQKDRRIDFPLASLSGVINEMGNDAPAEIKNPNLKDGGQGTGELSKAASVEEFTYIHTPNARLKEREERYLSKVASVQQRQDEREKSRQEKDHQSSLFKIANSIVMSERQYKNGNEVFNTLLSDVSLAQDDIDGIKKKASEIGDALVKTKRTHSGFVVTLKENPIEKVASHVLGEYSLLKVAESNDKVKVVKVQPTADVSDFNQLVTLARKLQQQASTGNEVN